MTVSRRFLAIAMLLVASVAGGCASAGTNQGSRKSSVELSEQELASANSDNLYDAIAKLRPDWLTSRGPKSATDMTLSSVDVYMNGTMLGGVDYLRDVRLLDVRSVRYWDAGQASMRFGMGHPRGVIELIRR